MSVKTPLAPVVKQLLTEMREQLNSQYRQRVALGARIDAAGWLEYVGSCIAPTVERVHALSPDRSKETLHALYDIGLDLFVLGHFSDTGKSIRLLELWQDTFPKLATVLGQSPRTIIGSLSNAVLYLNQWSDAKTARWITMIGTHGPSCENSTQLLSCGKFLAWIAGLAHLRSAAVDIASQLPLSVLRSTLGLSASVSEPETLAYLANLATNPWALPTSERGIQEVARCGNFRGLGGTFIHPPRLFLNDGVTHLTDGTRQWRLHADRFGYTFFSSESAATTHLASKKQRVPKIASNGTIHWGTEQLHRPDLNGLSSQSFDGTTLSVTIPNSYHVYLFARYE